MPIPTPVDLLLLLPSVPAMFRNYKQWFLRFSTGVDGFSMTTMLRRLHDVAPLILFVQTTQRQRFGAYIGDVLEQRHQHYGTDRLLLFRLDAKKDEAAVASPSPPALHSAPPRSRSLTGGRSSPSGHHQQRSHSPSIGSATETRRKSSEALGAIEAATASQFAIWPCTGKNKYYLLVNERGISIGSDVEGNVGLFLDAELTAVRLLFCLLLSSLSSSYSLSFSACVSFLRLLLSSLLSPQCCIVAVITSRIQSHR